VEEITIGEAEKLFRAREASEPFPGSLIQEKKKSVWRWWRRMRDEIKAV